MRNLFAVLTVLAVLGLGVWAYRQNYATQQSLRDLSRLQSDIASLRDALAMQRAEWAYLNRPERLRELALLNYDKLGLLPLDARQFAEISQIAYPPVVPSLQVGTPIETAGELPESARTTAAAKTHTASKVRQQ